MRGLLLALAIVLGAPAGDALAKEPSLVKLRDGSKPAPAKTKQAPKKKPARAAKRKPIRRKVVAKKPAKAKKKKPSSDTVRLRPMP